MVGAGGLWYLGGVFGENISTTTQQFIPFHFTIGTIVVVLFVCIFSV